MKAKRILSGILAAAIMLSFAGCGNSVSPESTESTKGPSATASVSEATSKPGGGETVGYQLPAGAESEYELYQTVVDFLNNGFHYDDLNHVYDLNLTIVFYSKCERKPEEIFTLGMKYDEACNLIARLRNRASKMDLPFDEYGEIDEDFVDYDAFRSEFPAPLQSQIDENDDRFEDFIELILYGDQLFRDGENPFSTDQTEWEKKSRDELETYEYDDYENWDEDLYSNFPRMYGIQLGTYISGDAKSMYMYYTEIHNRYYFIDFAYSVSGIGG